MRTRGRKAQALLESAMWVPILVLLLVGMIELARVSYTYYALHRILYSVGRLIGTQRGVNFCDDTSTAVADAKTFAVNGGNDEGATPIVTGLTADQIEVRIERYDASTGELAQCECSSSGCDTTQGGQPPDYVVVSLPSGYPMRLIFPGLNLDPIPLRPQIRVPYGGT